jgi:signal transduction histidine kinase
MVTSRCCGSSVRYRTYDRRVLVYSIGMLHEFLTANRGDLISRCRQKAAQRHAPEATEVELQRGIPLFIDQLIKTLQVEQTCDPMLSRAVSGPAGGGDGAGSEMGKAATAHGHNLMDLGFTVDQVVHDYGDVCQAVTDLAYECHAPIATDEFRTLNRCLDNVIADAVTEYSRRNNEEAMAKGVQTLNEQMGILTHELRDLLHTATLAIVAIKSGNVGLSGATGSVLDRSMIAMRDVIDRSIADVRVTAGTPPRRRVISLGDFMGDVRISATLEAKVAGCIFSLGEVDKHLAVDVDADMLFAAVGNLLQNGFKFTKPNTEVSLRAYAAADRIYIDVEDHCGGLEPGAAEKMFLPFVQNGEDRSGLGLGLTICQRSVEANDGILRVKDLPGSGCIFTIDLPRHSLPQDSPSHP